ncbi:MAG: VWA domain-containing protein [Candidatus Acidiferrales bacterium]
MALLFATLAACILLCPAPVFPSLALFHCAISAAQSQVPTMRIEVNLQPVDVQVKDSQGNDVLGLSANDFTVLENGIPQKVAFFDAGNSPVSIVVLVDSSSTVSSSGHLGSAQAIAAQFMRTARPGDDISAMDFTDQMGPFQQLTREQLLNPSTVPLAPAPSNGSALYDAIATALCHLRASKNPRQAVIVITDGVDQHSRLSLEQLLGLVRQSRAQLFMIGLQIRPEFNLSGHVEPRLTLESGHDIDNPLTVFDSLMKESGAESFIPKSQVGLDEALKAVSDMLQSEYTLAYYPPKTPAGLRKIEVKVDRHGAHVLARRFVDSDQDSLESVHFDEATCTVSPRFHPYPYESKLTRGPSGIIYREDFSDPHSGWPVHKDSHYSSGGYELSNLGSQGSNVIDTMPKAMDAAELPQTLPAPAATPETFLKNVIAAYGPWWSNFVAFASMDLKTASEDGGAYNGRPSAGIVFRMNLNGYYALLVSPTTDKKNKGKMPAEIVTLVRRDRQGESYAEATLVPETTVDEPSTSIANISVKAVGGQISIYVDGLEIQTVEDDTYKQGLVGFVISGPGQATFKNLVVEQK